MWKSSILKLGLWNLKLNIYVKNMMHNLQMLWSQFCRGDDGFKISCRKICTDIGQKQSDEEFHDACIKFTQKMIYTSEPRSILDKIKLPRSRSNAKLGLKIYPKNNKFRNVFINKIPEFYSTIPEHLRRVKPTIFKKKLKKITIRRK